MTGLQAQRRQRRCRLPLRRSLRRIIQGGIPESVAIDPMELRAVNIDGDGFPRGGRISRVAIRVSNAIAIAIRVAVTAAIVFHLLVFRCHRTNGDRGMKPTSLGRQNDAGVGLFQHEVSSGDERFSRCRDGDGTLAGLCLFGRSGDGGGVIDGDRVGCGCGCGGGIVRDTSRSDDSSAIGYRGWRCPGGRDGFRNELGSRLRFENR
mmetsp:Transcript_15318/g.32132  ORF Transcript_15318/g.32132 Transcript_15318/m.32132 type:complete len:206 (-) Transcript_15318:47-664(-)